MPILNNRDEDLRESWLANLLESIEAAGNCPNREEIAEMIDEGIKDHERRFIRQGIKVGLVVGSITGAIVLWIFAALWWIGQRIN